MKQQQQQQQPKIQGNKELQSQSEEDALDKFKKEQLELLEKQRKEKEEEALKRIPEIVAQQVYQKVGTELEKVKNEFNTRQSILAEQVETIKNQARIMQDNKKLTQQEIFKLKDELNKQNIYEEVRSKLLGEALLKTGPFSEKVDLSKLEPHTKIPEQIHGGRDFEFPKKPKAFQRIYWMGEDPLAHQENELLRNESINYKIGLDYAKSDMFNDDKVQKGLGSIQLNSTNNNNNNGINLYSDDNIHLPDDYDNYQGIYRSSVLGNSRDFNAEQLYNINKNKNHKLTYIEKLQDSIDNLTAKQSIVSNIYLNSHSSNNNSNNNNIQTTDDYLDIPDLNNLYKYGNKLSVNKY